MEGRKLYLKSKQYAGLNNVLSSGVTQFRYAYLHKSMLVSQQFID